MFEHEPDPLRSTDEELATLARRDFESREEKLEAMAQAWAKMLDTPSGPICLLDLYEFIVPDKPGFVEGSPEWLARHEARREVWLHIQERLRFVNVNIYNLLRGKKG